MDLVATEHGISHLAEMNSTGDCDGGGAHVPSRSDPVSGHRSAASPLRVTPHIVGRAFQETYPVGQSSHSEVVIVTTKCSTRGVRIIAAMTVLLSLQCADASASEDAVDRATQKALTLDAHTDRGGELFSQYCARCHGFKAQDNFRAVATRLSLPTFQLPGAAAGQFRRPGTR